MATEIDGITYPGTVGTVGQVLILGADDTFTWGFPTVQQQDNYIIPGNLAMLTYMISPYISGGTLTKAIIRVSSGSADSTLRKNGTPIAALTDIATSTTNTTIDLTEVFAEGDELTIRFANGVANTLYLTLFWV